MNIRSIALAVVVAGLAMSGCAKHPDSIAASYVSPVTYQTWTCPQLAEEANRLNQALALASGQQIKARGNDTVGIILLGLPVSSLSGDNIAPQIADLKGRLEAVEQTGIRKNCRIEIAALPPAIPPAEPRPDMPGLHNER